MGTKLIRRQEFIDKVELLSRGRLTSTKTLVSEKFADGLQMMLMALRCTSKRLEDFGEIKHNKLR